MSEKKNKEDLNAQDHLNDPLAVYRNAGITFSSIETQGDIQLRMSMDKSPSERLAMMCALNEYAYKNLRNENFTFKNSAIIFSSYEYLP